jgi:hypothetical protein
MSESGSVVSRQQTSRATLTTGQPPLPPGLPPDTAQLHRPHTSHANTSMHAPPLPTVTATPMGLIAGPAQSIAPRGMRPGQPPPPSRPHPATAQMASGIAMQNPNASLTAVPAFGNVHPSEPSVMRHAPQHSTSSSIHGHPPIMQSQAHTSSRSTQPTSGHVPSTSVGYRTDYVASSQQQHNAIAAEGNAAIAHAQAPLSGSFTVPSGQPPPPLGLPPQATTLNKFPSAASSFTQQYPSHASSFA